VGDREILETYSNSASKNTSERDIFPHGPKSLLTSVIDTHLRSNFFFCSHLVAECILFYSSMDVPLGSSLFILRVHYLKRDYCCVIL